MPTLQNRPASYQRPYIPAYASVNADCGYLQHIHYLANILVCLTDSADRDLNGVLWYLASNMYHHKHAKLP
jgi:hypothetical protein